MWLIPLDKQQVKHNFFFFFDSVAVEIMQLNLPISTRKDDHRPNVVLWISFQLLDRSWPIIFYQKNKWMYISNIWSVSMLCHKFIIRFGHQDGVSSIDCLRRERPVTGGMNDRTVRLWKVLEESQLVFHGHRWDSGVYAQFRVLPSIHNACRPC